MWLEIVQEAAAWAVRAGVAEGVQADDRLTSAAESPTADPSAAAADSPAVPPGPPSAIADEAPGARKCARRDPGAPRLVLVLCEVMSRDAEISCFAGIAPWLVVGGLQVALEGIAFKSVEPNNPISVTAVSPTDTSGTEPCVFCVASCVPGVCEQLANAAGGA